MSINPAPTISASSRRLSSRRFSSQELVLFLINLGFPREQISGQFVASLAFGVKLVCENHDQIQRNSEKARDEIDTVEFFRSFARFVVDKHFKTLD